MENKFLHIYSTVKVVFGSRRSLVQDLSSNKYYLIPNSFAKFIVANNNKSLIGILHKYNKDEHAVVKEYFDWLLKYNLGVCVDNLKDSRYLSALNCQWEEPYSITNCLIDIRNLSMPLLKKIVRQIDDLRISFAEIRIYNSLELKKILSIINEFQLSNITAINILTNFHSTLDINSIKNEIKYKLVINHLCIFNTPIKSNKQFYLHSKGTSILFSKAKLTEKLCGYIIPEVFNNNLKLYTESLTFNTCLNRKISIDENGEIKNCPSMVKSYGSINSITMEEALNTEGFKDAWNIKKDDILICKDCEFRHICTDCRAYLQDPSDIYSKPLKCGYDPYTNKWEDWATNPLSKIGIEYYCLQELVKTSDE